MNTGELRELDAKVAEKLFGEEWTHMTRDYVWSDIPEYSTDIKAAWLVVEKLREEYEPIKIIVWDKAVHVFIGMDERVFVDAPTAPEAICLAALKAVDAGR